MRPVGRLRLIKGGKSTPLRLVSNPPSRLSPPPQNSGCPSSACGDGHALPASVTQAAASAEVYAQCLRCQRLIRVTREHR